MMAASVRYTRAFFVRFISRDVAYNCGAIRAYSRGVHRQPLRVFTQEEASKLSSNPTIQYEEPAPSTKPVFRKEIKVAKPTAEKPEKIYSDRGITDEENQRQKQFPKIPNTNVKGGKFVASKVAPDSITLSGPGKEFEMTIIKDKITAERKLR